MVPSPSYCVIVLEGGRMQSRHRTLRGHANGIYGKSLHTHRIRPLTIAVSDPSQGSSQAVDRLDQKEQCDQNVDKFG